MDDPLGVGGVQRIRELDPELQQFLRLEGLPGDAVLQRLPLQQLHADEGLALVLVDVVDGADVRVIQGGRGPGFTPEPFEGDLVAKELLGQELQCDGSVETGVLGLVDDTHASATELLEDAVVGDGLADHRSPQFYRPVGTRDFTSSSQFWTRWMWVTGGDE
jgi:hypothetical protein